MLVVAKAMLLYAKSNIVMTYAGFELKTILSELDKMSEDYADLEKAQFMLAKYQVKTAIQQRL